MAPMAHTPTLDGPHVPALRPELVRLMDAGMLEHAAAVDGACPRPRLAANGALARAARRGVVTPAQAAALAGLLGLLRPANDR
jgi:hypothetical protein